MSTNRRNYRCCYINCNANTRNADPDITFFCFPKQTDPNRRLAWVRNAGYENVGSETLTMSLVHERICSKHFIADAFTTPAHQKLSRTAVPINYRVKSAIDLEKLLLKHGGVAKEHESMERFDVIVKASTLEVNDDPL